MRLLFRSIKWLLVGFWRLVNFTRLFLLNLIFLGVIVAIVISLNQEKPDVTVNDGALVLKLSGVLVEEETNKSPADQLIQQLAKDNEEPQEMKISDIVYAINKAKFDSHVKGIVIDADDLQTTSLTKLLPITRALDSFRTTKKPVVAVGNYYLQHQYFVAAHADTILLNPAGAVAIQGLGAYNLYFKSALEKFNIVPHIFRVGTYKSFVEPYLRDDMSPEAKENAQRWLSQMWQQYVSNVATARKIAPDMISPSKEQALDRLKKAEGNAAQYALDTGLVDELATPDDMIDTISDFAGAEDHSYRHIALKDYLKSLPRENSDKPQAPQIGVLIASGTLVDAGNEPGTINGEAFAEQIRKVMYDSDIKGLVIRVDSPGGSAFAAEQIRTALLAYKATGKPLVISMGSVAASGGYWISANADRIFAEPSTITGSIGVFGMFMTGDKALNALGIHADGVGTTDFTGLSPAQPFPEHIKQLIQMNVENTYQRFLGLVAEGRGMTPDQVDQIAQGRVWIGTDAKAHGLVDELGDLSAAAKFTANQAKLTDFRMTVIEPELSAKEKLLKELFSDSEAILPSGLFHSSLMKTLVSGVETTQKALQPLNLNDRQGIYSFCPVCQS